jgi:hypothetical protein
MSPIIHTIEKEPDLCHGTTIRQPHHEKEKERKTSSDMQLKTQNHRQLNQHSKAKQQLQLHIP